MRTIESLSNELWIEIFRYLNIVDQCRAFSQLNSRLDNLLFSHHYQLTFNGDLNESEYFLKEFLPKLKCRDQMKHLRLENLKFIDMEKNQRSFEFHHLVTLILHRITLTKDILAILSHTTEYLRSVRISSLTSGNKPLLNELRHLIFSRRQLRFCTVRLGIALCPLPLKLTNSSSIEHLRLISHFEPCPFDRLFVLLKYLPNLQTLDIVATDIKWISSLTIDSIDYRCPIRKFTLNVNRFDVPLNSWINHFIRLTSQLESIEIHSSTPLTDISYLNLADWSTIVVSSPHLKRIHLALQRADPLTVSSWKRSINALIRLCKTHYISFSIVPQP